MTRMGRWAILADQSALASLRGDRRQELTTAACPVESVAAGGEGAFLQAVQPLNIVDCLEHAVGETRVIREQHDSVVMDQGNACEGAGQREDRDAVEDVFQYLE